MIPLSFQTFSFLSLCPSFFPHSLFPFPLFSFLSSLPISLLYSFSFPSFPTSTLSTGGRACKGDVSCAQAVRRRLGGGNQRRRRRGVAVSRRSRAPGCSTTRRSTGRVSGRYRHHENHRHSPAGFSLRRHRRHRAQCPPSTAHRRKGRLDRSNGPSKSRRSPHLPRLLWFRIIKNRRVEYWSTCLSIRWFACTTHSFTGSAVLASLARSAALIRSLTCSLTHSQTRGK